MSRENFEKKQPASSTKAPAPFLRWAGGKGWSNSIKRFITEGHVEEWIPEMKGRVTIFIDPNDLMHRAKTEIVL